MSTLPFHSATTALLIPPSNAAATIGRTTTARLNNACFGFRFAMVVYATRAMVVGFSSAFGSNRSCSVGMPCQRVEADIVSPFMSNDIGPRRDPGCIITPYRTTDMFPIVQLTPDFQELRLHDPIFEQMGLDSDAEVERGKIADFHQIKLGE